MNVLCPISLTFRAPMVVRVGNWVMSAPAQKALSPAPLNSTTFMAESRFASSKYWEIRSSISNVMLLSLDGRFIVIIRTPSFFSMRTGFSSPNPDSFISNGPRGMFPPSFIAVSMSSAVAIPSSSTFSASFTNGSNNFTTSKPSACASVTLGLSA